MELYELNSQHSRTLVIKKLLKLGIPRKRIIAPKWCNNVIALLTFLEEVLITLFVRWIHISKYKPSPVCALATNKKQICD